MKNAAKCDTWCELQNPANHRVFERKLRPKPFGRGHVCLGVTQHRSHPIGVRGIWPPVRFPPAVGPKKRSSATNAATIGGLQDPRTLSHHEALSASRVVWECSPNRAVNSVQG